MGMFEEIYIYIYPLIETISKFYLQFIGHSHSWTGTADQIMKFKK